MENEKRKTDTLNSPRSTELALYSLESPSSGALSSSILHNDEVSVFHISQPSWPRELPRAGEVGWSAGREGRGDVYIHNVINLRGS